MKKLLIVLIASISILQLNAQTNQGTISYEKKLIFGNVSETKR